MMFQVEENASIFQCALKLAGTIASKTISTEMCSALSAVANRNRKQILEIENTKNTQCKPFSVRGNNWTQKKHSANQSVLAATIAEHTKKKHSANVPNHTSFKSNCWGGWFYWITLGLLYRERKTGSGVCVHYHVYLYIWMCDVAGVTDILPTQVHMMYER